MATMRDVMDERSKISMIHDHAASLTIEDLEDAMSECGIETADGCWVETDGRCEHGFPSPMLVLGYI